MSDTQKTLDGEEALELTLPDWVDTDVDRADEIEDRLEDELYTGDRPALHVSNLSVNTSQGGLSLGKTDRGTSVVPIVDVRCHQSGVGLELFLDDDTADTGEGSVFVGDVNVLFRPDEARELISRLEDALDEYEAESGGDE